MNPDNFGKGAQDPREAFRKPQAWHHEEIAGAFAPATWIEKDPYTGFATYPKRNQGMQSSCVTYVLAKQLSVDELSENGKYRELSPRSIYPYVYMPGGGSNSIVAAKRAVKFGMTLEALLPSDGLNESDVEKDDGYVLDAKQVAMVYKPQSFIECATDFETIASIIQGHKDKNIKKVVAVTIIGSNNGTWLSLMPKPPTDPANVWYHKVAVTDFGLVRGKKYLAIDNSWGDKPGNAGQQLLSSEYEHFIYGGIYTLNAQDDWQTMAPADITPPKHEWLMDLQVGSTGDDVLALQKALQSMGMFPVSKVVQPTGIFGGMTKTSVVLFQQAFGIPQTGNVGPMTRAKLNELFAG